MSGLIAKMLFTAALGVICAVAAFIVTQPAQTPPHHGGSGRRRSRSPPRTRNTWNNDRDSDSGSETYHTPPTSATTTAHQRAGASDEEQRRNEEISSSCKICLDSFTWIKKKGGEIYSTNCGHLFCKGCIHNHLQNSRSNSRCPICRKAISTDTIHPIYLY